MQPGSHRSLARHSPTPSYSSSSASVTSSASVSSNTSNATITHNSMSSSPGGPRTSMSSGRSSRHRNQVNLSTVEKLVTDLLEATKKLLQTLTRWSQSEATDKEVSDAYVQLGSDFNATCRAFKEIGIETADLGNVPDALRTILESTLSQEASPQSLDNYLPEIRQIIIKLLQGLKRKQQKLRQRPSTRDSQASQSSAEAGPSSRPPVRSSRNRSLDAASEELGAPPRTSSLPAGRISPSVPSVPARESAPSLSGASRGSRPSISSAPGYQPPSFEVSAASPATERGSLHGSGFVPPPPPPIPQQTDALAALAQHSSLERRASRRYSAYQIAKLTGQSRIDVPVMPSSRIPSNVPGNRESMEAIRKRASSQSSKTKSVGRGGEMGSPVRHPPRITEEAESAAQPDGVSSPAKTPDDIVGVLSPPPPEPKQEIAKPPLTVDTGAAQPAAPAPEPAEVDDRPVTNGVAAADEKRISTDSETPKETTLFLQLGRSVKKVTLNDDPEDITITALRLLFISKFNYNPPSGDDFPEIYLQDPVSGVRYELEDMRDVKDRAVLCLNVEVLDEVKRHIDDGIGSLKKIVQGIAGSVESQGRQISRVATQQEETAAKLAALAESPPVVVAPSAAAPAAEPKLTPMSKTESDQRLTEVRDIRKDLAVLRQVYTGFVTDMTSSMDTIRAKANNVKTVAIAPKENSWLEGRTYVETGKAQLGADADVLVNRVDDLQDTVEDLRKDVVARGVRPVPRQLEAASKEIAQARLELKKLNEYIKREKPLFRKVWERELEVVCAEQEFFNMQENLMADLEDDLEKATETFALVKQCSQQQLKTTAGGLRVASKGFGIPVDDVNPGELKDGVLNEVRALQPNHESRLEAIERAERMRQRDMKNRGTPFQKELGKFVEEDKLKKTGGAEEVERRRAQREEEARKAIWEFKLKVEAEEEESSEEEETDEEDDEEEDDETEDGEEEEDDDDDESVATKPTDRAVTPPSPAESKDDKEEKESKGKEKVNAA